MITTYSYLDQYKQIGLGAPIDYFVDTTIAVTPFPLTIVISESNEYGITITDAEALSFGLTPGLELVPSETLCPSNGINVQVTISGGS